VSQTRSMKTVRFGLILLLFAIPLLAQLKVDVQLINVVATVTDNKGRYVADLTEDDLIVEEDGQPQEIVHFSQSNDLPVSLGIVLDTSGSMERKISTATRAVERFIRLIHEDDDIFLMTFSNRPDLRQDFTDDREKLTSALRRVTVGGGTSLYDALDMSLRKVRRGKHEKKAILLISDGEDTTSETTLDEVMVGIRESELLVYSLGISPASGGILTDPGRGPSIGVPIPGIPGGIPIPGVPGRRRFPALPQRDPRQVPPRNEDTLNMNVLNMFADASGGKAWRLSGNWTEGRGSEIQRAMDEIADELRNQYSVGYYAPHALNDGKWHRIEIKARNKNYRVRARKEYFGK
jgi:Ca-activated chloride channel family protein